MWTIDQYAKNGPFDLFYWGTIGVKSTHFSGLFIILRFRLTFIKKFLIEEYEVTVEIKFVFRHLLFYNFKRAQKIMRLNDKKFSRKPQLGPHSVVAVVSPTVVALSSVWHVIFSIDFINFIIIVIIGINFCAVFSKLAHACLRFLIA